VRRGIDSEHAANLPNIRFRCRPEMMLLIVTPPNR